MKLVLSLPTYWGRPRAFEEFTALRRAWRKLMTTIEVTVSDASHPSL